MIGKTVSHYKIIEKLGEGGMGVVYKAQDTKLKRTVALKFLAPELTRDEQIKERFTQEAIAASALQHHNICTIHEIDTTDDGQMFICMDYYEGKTLKEKIECGPLKLKEVIDIAMQTADGLSKAHERGIVHRDIKPANILITDDGVVKIVDFGLAKLAGQTKLTKVSTTIGTAAYMSPEQTKGEEVDQRTDIWSLGVVMYEMITGKLPFQGEYEQAMMFCIVNEEPAPMTALRTGVPVGLERIVNSAISKPLEIRCQNMEDLKVDLERLEKDLESGVSSGPKTMSATTKDKSKKSIASRTIRVLIGSIAVILLIFGMQRILKKGLDLTFDLVKERSIAVLPFSSLTGTKEDEIFSDGIHDDILTQLTKIGDLKVIARTSVMQYRNTQKRIRDIARELDVTSILEGTVRREGSRIRIGAQLIDAKTENHLWAETYDREYADVFAIQSDLAQKIAHALKATLTTKEKKSIEEKPTDILEAYDHYLKGNYYLNNYQTKESYEKAVQMYEKAVELDTNFAVAYAKLAIVHAVLYVPKTWDHTIERLEKTKSTLSKANEIAPDLPEIHHANGYYLEWIEHDFDRAMAEYKIALRDAPNNSELLGSMGTIYLRQGQSEKATQFFTKSYERDPKSINQDMWVSWSYQLQRKWTEAEKWINIATSNHPDYGLGYYRKTEIYIYGYGNLEAARSVMQEGQKYVETIDRTFYPSLIELYARNYREALAIREADSTRPRYNFVLKGQILDFMGQHEKAIANYEYGRSLLEKLIKESPENAFHYSALGLAFAGLGNKEEAIKWGKQAIEMHPIQTDPWSSGEDILLEYAHINIIVGEYEEAIDQIRTLLSIPSRLTKWSLKLDPIYDPLRNNPRFQALVGEN